jgi:hypothetical protein
MRNGSDCGTWWLRRKRSLAGAVVIRQSVNVKNDDSVTVLDRLLEPLARCLTPESARAVIDLRADAAAHARVSELAEKCNEGTLTPEERREYETYVHVGNLIAILKAKARLLLRQPVS